MAYLDKKVALLLGSPYLFDRVYNPTLNTEGRFLLGAERHIFRATDQKVELTQLCCCTISAENVAPRAKFRLVENRF